MKGKDGSITFLSLKSKIGRPVGYVKDRENICLTVDQAKYIYKKVEQESIVNAETINKDNTNNEEEVKPY